MRYITLVSLPPAVFASAGYVEEKKAFVDRRPRTMYRLTTAGRKAFDEYRRAMLATLGS